MNNQKPSHFVTQGNIFYAIRRYENALRSFKKAATFPEKNAFHRHKIRMTEFQISVRKDDANTSKPTETI